LPEGRSYQKQPASDPSQNADEADIDPKPVYGGFLARRILDLIDHGLNFDK
jgi:hypothetical protein